MTNPLTGFGDCRTGSLAVRGPIFKRVDLSLAKLVRLKGSANVELRFEVLNAFDNVNFVPVGGLSSTVGNMEVNNLTGEPTARQMQIVSRINW